MSRKLSKMSEEKTLKFVQLYKQFECLWNFHTPDYKNKFVRAAALQEICDEMYIDGFGINEAKSKIKSLRCTYYLELDKIEKSIRSGCERYESKLKWFPVLHSFIKDVVVKRKSSDKSAAFNQNEDEEQNTSHEDPLLLSDTMDLETLDDSFKSEMVELHAPTSPPKRRKTSTYAELPVITIPEESEFDLFGKCVASQLKKLSEEQAVIARQEIQSILSKCRLTDIRSNKETQGYLNEEFKNDRTFADDS